MRILVADDEAVSRQVLAGLLKRAGHEVETAVEGEDALARLLRPDGPSIALLDWQMPGVDGIEICRRLRQEGRPGRDIYLILVSARADRREIILGLEAGADDFLPKPVDGDELRARVMVGERQLRLQADRARTTSYLQSVLASMDSGVLLTDAEGRIVYANSALTHLVPVAAALGRRRDDAFRAHGAALVDTATLEAMASEGAAGGYREADVGLGGDGRIYRWLTQPIRLPDGFGRLDLFRDVTAERRREREQERLAFTDALTGLGNRREGDATLARELSRARRTGQPLGLALFDIDHFKRINDGRGHATGDAVLKEVGAVLQQCIRTTDVVVRWGGEEFLAILPGSGRPGGVRFAERARVAIERMRRPNLPEVTVSAGVSEVVSDGDLAEALALADQRLYAAKAAGRNRVG